MPYLSALPRFLAVTALLAALAGCSEERAAERQAEALVERSAAVAPERVACAHAGEAPAPDCTVDRERGKDGLILTVRHPDGAFRRLAVATDGRGVVAADGAEPARVTILDADAIEVAIGGDRYRLPATVRAGAAAP